MDIHECLLESAQAVKEYRKIQQRLQSSEDITTAQREHLNVLKDKMIAEGRDLEALDSISLFNLWHSIRGTKEAAKQKEEQEYLAAKLKFEEAAAALKASERELVLIKQKLAKMGDPEREYQEAIKAKANFLIGSDSSVARQLFEFDEKVGSLKAEGRELGEAIEAGHKAKQALKKVESILSNAQGWGVVDVMGGGLLTTAIKHSRLNDARQEIHQAQEVLRRFQRELADIQVGLTLEIGSLATFADYLFDGLLVDVIVQSRINSAKNHAKQMITKVQTVVKNLEQILNENNKLIEELGVKRIELIEKA